MTHWVRMSLHTMRTVTLAIGFIFLIIGIGSSYYVTTTYQVPADSGAEFGPGPDVRTRTLLAVTPGSAAESAGLRAGDTVVAPPYTLSKFTRFAGQRIDLTVLQAGEGKKTVPVVLMPLGAGNDVGHRGAVRILDVSVSVLTVLTALLILLRAPRTHSNTAICLALICLGYTAYILPLPSIVRGSLLTWLAAFDESRFFIAQFSMVLFAHFLTKEKLGAVPSFAAVMNRTVFAVIASAGLSCLAYGFLDAAAFLPDPRIVQTAVSLLAAVVTFFLILVCWSRSVESERARAAMLAVSIGILMLSSTLMTFSWLSWKLYAAGEMLTVLFLLTFGYAIVRHKVLDLGFAINRALVFTVISTALLIVFGVTEFAVDKLLHFEGRQKNVIFDAAVALGIILCFHRIQHWVSQRIDHTFFHHWYAAAQELRTFMQRAPHIVGLSALEENYLVEMKKFCRARSIAQFQRRPDLSYVLTQGGTEIPTVIAADCRLAIALRHGRAPVDMSTEEFEIKSGFAFPMVLRGAVMGIILISPRSDGTSYRPDEIKLLSECVRSYTADLESLRVERLEREMATMAESKARLEKIVGRRSPSVATVSEI
jgi:hypothetical protein